MSKLRLLVLVGATACARPAAAPTASVPWDSMSMPQRHAYMTTTVTPRMAAAFTGYDPHRYPTLSCATCHGKTGVRQGWAMPNPDLLLEPTSWNSTPAPEPAYAPSRMDAFMAGSVATEMSTLLGRPSGCFACHTPER